MSMMMNGTMPMMPSTVRPPVPPDMVVWMARNKLYPKQVWWFVASFIGLVMAIQIASWVGKRAFASGSNVADSEGRGGMPQRKLQLGRFPLAIVNYARVIAFRHTIDVGDSISVTYAEAFIAFGYMLAIFIWEFINTTSLSGSMLNVNYWSTRAGALAVSQFPLITVLGTKNNLLSYLTGVSYDKLNYLHRMTARTSLILLWVHGASKFQFLTAESYKSQFIQIGLAGLIGFTVVGVLAFRPLRARLYELFFYAHFSLILVMLIGGYFHAQEAARLGIYIWPCFLIWGLDRALRFLRVVYFNRNLFAAGEMPTVSATLLSPQFVRLRLARPPHFKWTPGQAAYIFAPGISLTPGEAHPFTIASVDSRYRLKGSVDEKMPMDDDMGMDTGVSMGSQDDFAAHVGGGGQSVLPYWEEVEFFINVRDGFTKRLAEAVRRGKGFKVHLDGPYGFSPDLKHDDTVVFVAGGSGVSLALSSFLGVVSDVQNHKSRCRKVVFIWSIRDLRQLMWISRALRDALQCAPSSLEISIRIFVTGERRLDKVPLMMAEDHQEMESPSLSESLASGSMPSSGETTPRESATETDVQRMPMDKMEDVAQGGMMRMPRELQDFPSVDIIAGRPDIPKLLKDEVAHTSGGRLSVTVCGSAGIAKSCQNALKLPFSSVLYGGPSVVLHVESFGYA